MQGGTASTSRLGFRGTEDIGGGTKAGFVAEAAMGALTGGANNSFLSNSQSTGNRQTFVYVEKSGLGKVAAGYQYTGTHLTRAALDPFGGANMPGNLSIAGGVAGTVNSASAQATATSAFGTYNNNDYDTRATALSYTAPTYMGLTVGGGVVVNDKVKEDTATGAATSPTGKSNAFALTGDYTSGPLTVLAAYSNKTAIAATVAAAPLDGTATAFTAGADGDRAKQYFVINKTVGAKYTMGATTFSGAYFADKKTYNIPATGLSDVNNRGTLAAVKHVIGQYDLLASYSKGKYQTGVATATNLDRAQSGYQVGGVYNFSKRTNAYLLVGSQQREAATAGERNLKDSAYAIGLRHNF